MALSYLHEMLGFYTISRITSRRNAQLPRICRGSKKLDVASSFESSFEDRILPVLSSLDSNNFIFSTPDVLCNRNVRIDNMCLSSTHLCCSTGPTRGIPAFNSGDFPRELTWQDHVPNILRKGILQDFNYPNFLATF